MTKKVQELIEQYVKLDRDCDRIGDIQRLLTNIEGCATDSKLTAAVQAAEASVERIWQITNDAYWDTRRDLWNAVIGNSSREKKPQQPSKGEDHER